MSKVVIVTDSEIHSSSSSEVASYGVIMPECKAIPVPHVHPSDLGAELDMELDEWVLNKD